MSDWDDDYEDVGTVEVANAQEAIDAIASISNNNGKKENK